MMEDPLSVDELRSIDEGTYLVVDLDSECYWEQGEGEVKYVTERDDGRVSIGIAMTGFVSKLKIPADGRKSMRYNGAARGATNLRVTDVYEK